MSYTSEVLADSPLAYYRLGEPSGATMSDSSGNARHGTYTGSPTLGVTGAITGDTACAFAAATPSHGDTAFAAWMTVNQHTLEAWVKRSGNPASSEVVFGRTGTSNSNAWFAITAAGKIFYQTRTASNASVTGTVTVTDGNWHHIVCTYNGSQMIIYVDGVQDNLANRSGTISTTGNNLQVAGRGDAFLTGSVDEAAYYGTALSSVRVAAHYAAAAVTNYNGDTAKTVTISTSSAGRLGLTGAAAKTVTISRTAAASLGVTGVAAKQITVATSSAGQRGALGAASKTISVSTSSDGLILSGVAGDAAKTVTISATAAGALGLSGQAVKVVTVATSSTGVRGRTGAAAKTLTLSTSSDGTVTSGGGGASIRLADGTTLTAVGYADGSKTLTVLGWLDADGVTIHPFA